MPSDPACLYNSTNEGANCSLDPMVVRSPPSQVASPQSLTTGPIPGSVISDLHGECRPCACLLSSLACRIDDGKPRPGSARVCHRCLFHWPLPLNRSFAFIMDSLPRRYRNSDQTKQTPKHLRRTRKPVSCLSCRQRKCVAYPPNLSICSFRPD